MTADGSASFDIKAFFRTGPIRWLVVGGVFLIAAITIGTTIMADNFRERALNSRERELENTVLLLTRQFDQHLEDFTIVEKDIAAQILSAGITPDTLRAKLANPEFHEMLKAKVGSQTDMAGVHLFDAEGRLVNSSDVWPVPDVSITDRSSFKTFKSGAPTSPILIELAPARFGEGWAVILAQKLVGQNGEFVGVVTRGIAPASFEKFFESMALGEGAAITMYLRDGTLVARYPHIEPLIGRNFKSGVIHQQIFAHTDHGTTRLASPMDGLDRLAAARTLTKFPISIIATTTVTAALEDWREQTRSLIVIAGLFVIVIAALLFLVVRKLSKQHQMEKQRLDTAINNMRQGLLLFDSSQRLVVCNQRYIEMYGLSADVLKPGLTFHEVITHRRDTGSFLGDVDEYCAHVLREIPHRNSMTIETSDGRCVHIINEPLADGGWVATHEDITERKHAEERITHLAHYDALTDLPNRTLFRERLKKELNEIAPGQQLAVLYIDIDEFKSVNDSLGHMIGDELLKSVANSFRRCIGGADFVARLGGDEFAIVMTAVKTEADVTDLVERALEAIRAPYQCLGHQVATDASIGIALAPQHGADLDQILKNADMAMYAAKAAGRRTYRFFEPAMDAQVKARRILEMDLRQAIADEALEVYYQPCVGLQGNTINGCEALVRWRHPERGMISPVEFIPIAEETGLINQLGEWVLATACAEATKWPDDTRLAVNVSPVQFRSGTLALKVVAALSASGLPAHRLELEITEAVLIRDDEAALEILHQLRAIGVRIALDDFGTGYSSLSYLQRFPFDKIKIDRCFVTDIAKPSGSSGIVRAVVNIAAERHMTTTAEGVETLEQQDLLRALGCTEMQGYLFSPPKPAAEIRQLLFGHRAKAVAVA